jgi:phosphatidate cytidylyltransferase
MSKIFAEPGENSLNNKSEKSEKNEKNDATQFYSEPEEEKPKSSKQLNQYNTASDQSKNQTQEPKQVRNKNEKNESEFASQTCFSSETELKFKRKPSKIANVINKIRNSFQPPQSTQVVTSKFSDLKDRTIWTIFMLIFFIGFILLGNSYCALLVFVVIMLIYSELIDLERYRDRNKIIKNYYPIAWFYFFVCTYYFYIKVLSDKIGYMNQYVPFNYLFRYHNLISFGLYIIGFIAFIRSLTKGYYKYQFQTFAWIHILLIIFGISSSFILSNVFNGLVWFILPASLVICNDIMAYICGRLFGKNMLTELSPKKTIEGFIGALICTLLFCYYVIRP